MRRDKETNEKFFLDGYLETTHSTHQNISKLQDALKNLDNENIFHEENARKTSQENRESMITIRNENMDEDENEEKRTNRENHDLREYHDNSDNSLDGWDEDILERNHMGRIHHLNSSFKDLFMI
jgi:hypothetical protein